MSYQQSALPGDSQAIAYFESGGLDEPGLRLLIYGDSLAGGWTRITPNPTPDCPWSDLFKRELQGLAREVEAVGIMGATTQSVVEHMDNESGLRRKIREATTAIGRNTPVCARSTISSWPPTSRSRRTDRPQGRLPAI